MKLLPNKLYDILKWIAILALPAFAQYIPKLFEIWNIPYGEQIGETLSATAVLLGILLGISAVSYAIKSKNGKVVIEQEDKTNE